MTQKMWNKTYLILIFVVLIADEVYAQSMAIGPQLGYYKARGTDTWAYMVGAAWRLKVSDLLSAEISVNNHQENYANNTVTVRSWPVMVTGLIFPFPPVVYGSIGAGWYSLTYDYNKNTVPLLTDETTEKIGWHFGCGLALPISQETILNMDIRYAFVHYNFQAFSDSGDLKTNFTVITIGFLLDI